MINYETTYLKIPNIFKRDNISGKLIDGCYSTPELNYLSNCEFVCTEKIDGTNIRIIWDGYDISFKGRKEKSVIPQHLLDYLENTFNTDTMEELFEELFGNKFVIIFGEGYGHKIQSVGDLYRNDCSFIAFDIMIGKDRYLDREALVGICKKLNVPVVPIVMVDNLQNIVEYIKSFPDSLISDRLTMEGVVAKPTRDIVNLNGDRIICKIKCCDFK